MTTALVMDVEERRRIDTTIDRLRLGGKKLTTNVAAQITDGSIEYGMETAYTLNLSIHDPDRRFLRANVLKDGYRASLKRTDVPGWDKFALVSVSKTSDSLELIFEDEVVWRLRRHKGFDKVPRNTMTRAEFIYKIIREVTHPTVKFVSPQMFVKQPILTSDQTRRMGEDAAKDPVEGYGFKQGVDVNVKGGNASATQKSNMKKVLDVGVRKRAPKTILVTAVNVMIVNSSAGRGPDPSSSDIEASAVAFYNKAIPIFAAEREWEPWRIAYELYKIGSADSKGRDTYGKITKEARANVNAYLGTNSYGYAGSINRIQRQKFARYDFTRGNLEDGEAEDTWTAARRLADEVGWRLYAFRNTIYFVNDNDLKTRPEWAKLTEQSPGVIDIDFSWDVGKPVSEVNLSVTAERFGAPPGAVILLKGLGDIVDEQRWLVSDFSRSLFSPVANIALKVAVAPSPEPAPQVETEKVNIDTGAEVDDKEGLTRGKIVEIAKKQLARTAAFIYAQVRPIPTTLDQNSIRTDCSGFTTMVYRAAGAPDPNGRGYDGQGSTATQWPTGKAVSKPQPGDLVFYGTPGGSGSSAHVAIVINETEAIGFGSPGGPRRHSITYDTVTGYRAYLLGD